LHASRETARKRGPLKACKRRRGRNSEEEERRREERKGERNT